MTRNLVRLMLERDGFIVLEAEDGFDALDKVKESLPDLIILDVMMPRMDGIATCKALRGDARTAEIPIIILSAKTLPDSVTAGLEAGANAYLSKLTPRKELVQHICGLLGDAKPEKPV
jgi:DNA-binding response OmpR family regulator